jgi:cobalt-zinc-cadmium resistance protein CzcA
MVGHDDDDDVVQGIVLMRYGGETPSTLEGVHRRVKYIEQNNVLPPGMKIQEYYDRGELTKLTTETVVENLVVGMLLVVLVQFLFLGAPTAAIISAVNLPLSLFVAFISLVATGTSANLISIGAVDFGIISDSTIIMMENIIRHLGAKDDSRSMLEKIGRASSEVGGPMFFSTLIIAVAFLPLFTLTGVPGAIFSPMARTYAYAISGAILLAITLTPVLASKSLPAHMAHEEEENALMRFLHRLYNPLFDAALRRPKVALAIRALPIFGVVLLFPLLGRDFMPKLEEGNLWIRATLPMSISLEKSAEYTTKMRRILRGCPKDLKAECSNETRTHKEVVTVISQLGRPDDGTDVTGFFNIEFFAPLKPFKEWPSGMTKKDLTDRLNAELSEAFPGVVFNFSQYISDNVEEAVAGVKGENCVKVFGPSLHENERVAEQIVDVLKDVPGVTDLGLFKSLGQPNIKITPDRVQLARYGLNTGDVNNVVQSAIGGNAITQVYEGEKLFDLAVRWHPRYRSSLEAIREITVFTPDGYYIPLGQIAKIEEVEGPTSVYRQDGVRYAPVKFGVRGRDLASAIDEARKVVNEKVHKPYNIHFEWEGEIQELKSVEDRLLMMIPITIFIIGFLVYMAVKNWLDTLIVLIDIPVACTGGVMALLLTKTHFSVSAAMGFVSVFGIAVQDALLMVMYFQMLHFQQGMSVEKAARQASEKRFRPVLMTTMTAMLGLLPAALSNGIGAQTQKPLAIVVIGGALELAILTRLLQPPMRVIAYNWLQGWRERHKKGSPPPPIGHAES